MSVRFPGARPLLLPEIQDRASPVTLLSHPALQGVEVLPYVEHSLVFAQIAAAAVALQSRLVLVDLPARMSRLPGTLNLPLALLPLFSVVIYPAAAGGRQLGIPVSPASPPIAAALVARQRGLPMRCIAPEFISPPAATVHQQVSLPEDYRVYRSGLSGHFAGAWSALDAGFMAASDNARLFATLRAASALHAARSAQRRTRLLVVEWRLWWLMSRLLDGAITDPSDKVQALPPRMQDTLPILYLPDPVEAWCKGLLDDYPALVNEFHGRIGGVTPPPGDQPAGNVLPLPNRMAWSGFADARSGAAASDFDKRASLDRLLVEVVTSIDAPPESISTRKRLAFASYLPRLAMGYAVPKPASHALQAARACGGEALASRLRRAILAYPRPPAVPARADARAQPSIDDLANGWGTPLARCATDGGSEESQLRDEELLAAALDREGAMRELLGEPVGATMFTVAPEYRLHESIVRMAQRKAAGAYETSFHSRPYFASVEAGINFQATLRSYASNPRGTVYVRHESASAAMDVDRWTPVVFMLESAEVVNSSTIMPILDANPAAHRVLRAMDAGSERRDHMFTVMTCIRGARRHHDGHVKVETLSAVGWLFASALMGPERYAQAIARCRIPCRTDPDFEPEWKTWSRLERLLGWALKYGSGRSIVVVAGNGFDVGPRVSAYAAARGTRIFRAPLDRLPAAGVEHLRQLLLVSSNIKNHASRDRVLELLASNRGSL